MQNKKGVITDYLIWLLIAIAILAIVLISIFVLKEKGFSLIDKIKKIFSGGRFGGGGAGGGY